MSDDEGRGIRGDELATDAAGGDGAPPAPAEHGVRGEGLATDAATTDASPPEEEAGDRREVRGDGLATDA